MRVFSKQYLAQFMPNQYWLAPVIGSTLITLMAWAFSASNLEKELELIFFLKIQLLFLGVFITAHWIMLKGSFWLAKKLKKDKPTLWNFLLMSVVCAAINSSFMVGKAALDGKFSKQVHELSHDHKVNLEELEAEKPEQGGPFKDNFRRGYDLGLEINDPFEEFLTGFILFSLFNLMWLVSYYSLVARRRKKALKAQLEQQQLASLVNQINPHFLFNTLNSIRGMMFQDEQKAVQVVDKLINLFEYNLSNQIQASSKVSAEWQICEQYLEIEKVRLGDRLTLNVEGYETVKDCMVPSLMLLTLVENAIKHGVSHLPKGGEIHVMFVQAQNELQITVRNPFNPARVKSGTQLGLKNIQKRLALMFGTHGTLSISHDQHQFCAQIKVPNNAQ